MEENKDGLGFQRLWIKILNPMSNIVITHVQLTDLFERFARGSMQDSPTLISTTFAEQMLDLIEKEGCCSSSHETSKKQKKSDE